MTLERGGDQPAYQGVVPLEGATLAQCAENFFKVSEQTDTRIAGHYRLDAVRAHLLERAGDRRGAIACYRQAAERTASLPERDYLVAKAARLATAPDTASWSFPDASSEVSEGDR